MAVLVTGGVRLATGWHFEKSFVKLGWPSNKKVILPCSFLFHPWCNTVEMAEGNRKAQMERDVIWHRWMALQSQRCSEYPYTHCSRVSLSENKSSCEEKESKDHTCHIFDEYYQTALLRDGSNFTFSPVTYSDCLLPPTSQTLSNIKLFDLCQFDW